MDRFDLPKSFRDFLSMATNHATLCHMAESWKQAARRITIKIQDGEYRVPTGSDDAEATAYYTDDRNDAIDTAKHAHGADVVIRFKREE